MRDRKFAGTAVDHYLMDAVAKTAFCPSIFFTDRFRQIVLCLSVADRAIRPAQA